MPEFTPNKRTFLQMTAAATASIVLPDAARSCLNDLDRPVKFGLIADLHQDIMHDAPLRLKVFLDAMQNEKPDALLQLGDFAYPTSQNDSVTKSFEEAHKNAFHVLGNHEIDGGHSFAEVAKLWNMKGRYYTEQVQGINLIVLDCNEKPPGHRGGYPSHIGPQQMNWFESQLKELHGPIIVFSHQPLAGPSCIDNASVAQRLLTSAADRVLMAVNGHTHIDHLTHVGKIPYLHLNSASYKWVGGSHRNRSYADEIHSKHRWIEYTCPYRTCLYATLTIDPKSGRIELGGSESDWVGKSPSQLGIADQPDLINGKQVCPEIRDRRIPPSES